MFYSMHDQSVMCILAYINKIVLYYEWLENKSRFKVWCRSALINFGVGGSSWCTKDICLRGSSSNRIMNFASVRGVWGQQVAVRHCDAVRHGKWLLSTHHFRESNPKCVGHVRQSQHWARCRVRHAASKRNRVCGFFSAAWNSSWLDLVQVVCV